MIPRLPAESRIPVKTFCTTNHKLSFPEQKPGFQQQEVNFWPSELDTANILVCPLDGAATLIENINYLWNKMWTFHGEIRTWMREDKTQSQCTGLLYL
jgi:hypothetical protein